MTKERKTYMKEFKIEAVRLLESSGRSQETIAKELGTSSSSLSRWKKKHGEDGEDAFPGAWEPHAGERTRSAAGA